MSQPASAAAPFVLLALIALAPWTGAAAPAAAAPAAALPPRLQLHACRVEGVPDEVRCGTLRVWEDRQARRGRQIGLRIVVLPAKVARPAPDPIFVLAGGPGQSVVELAGYYAGSDLRRQRDMVLVDQRGTGGSNPLFCHFYGTPPDLRPVAAGLYTPEAVAECRRQLEKAADLRLYTTPIAMDDLDEVRAALGYGQIDLFGGSYGSRAAQVYMRQHGTTVRAAVLESVSPVDELLPLRHARNGKRAIDLLLAACAADAACHAAYPRLPEELQAVLRRCDERPAVTIEDPATHRQVEVHPDRGLIAEGIRFLLYDADTHRVPALIHRAFGGDLAELVTESIRQRLIFNDQILAMGEHFSATCAEDLPFIDAQAAARETAGTYLGDYRIREQQQVCALWPRGAVPADLHEPVRSGVPTLLLSSERDPVTPPAFAERVAAKLSHHRHVVFTRGGHGRDEACVAQLAIVFLDRGLEAVDPTCATVPGGPNNP